MRAVVQRVLEASVSVNEKVVAKIQTGLLVYLGVQLLDNELDAEYLADKIVGLRVFEDEGGRMNCTLDEADGALLIVSQFTLYGDCRKGKRPSFSEAASPEKARTIYDYFVARCRESGREVFTGMFREAMEVRSVNGGPVTLLLNSQKLF